MCLVAYVGMVCLAICTQHNYKVDFPRCNNNNNDWYMSMPVDPPPVDLKVEMLLELCEGRGATLESVFPMINSLLPH